MEYYSVHPSDSSGVPLGDRYRTVGEGDDGNRIRVRRRQRVLDEPATTGGAQRRCCRRLKRCGRLQERKAQRIDCEGCGSCCSLARGNFSSNDQIDKPATKK